MEYISDFVLFGPIIASVVAGVLLHSGLRASNQVDWRRVGVGIALLALTCYGLFYLASFGLLVSVFASLLGLIIACVAAVAGFWMFWRLRGMQGIIALVVGILFPIALYFGIRAGNAQAPENVTQRNGDIIIQALHRYYTDTRTYPGRLTDLEPSYLAAEPDALTTQSTGWLYTGNDKEFTLGYWYWPDKFGAEVCLYQSGTQSWECGANNWGPFRAVPTPMWP
jgi:hypothetical protein